MAKMRWGNDIDWRGLNDAEYSDDDFADYDGPVPPNGTILQGQVKKLWASATKNGDPMIKALFEASGNTGDRKVYNGCGVWDNVLFTMPQVKFKWQPFLDALGITLLDLKNKTVTGDSDNMGDVIERIGAVKLPIDVRVKTKREKFDDEWSAKVGRWLPANEEESDDDDDEYEDDDDDDGF